MTTPSHRARVLAALSLATLTLSGCGSSPEEEFAQQSGTEILEAAYQATNGIKAFRVRGTLSLPPDMTFTMDAFRDAHRQCSATIVMRKDEKPFGRMQLVVTPRAQFIKGDAAFWNSESDLPRPPRGTWLRTAAAAKFAGMCPEDLQAERLSSAKAKVGGVVTIDEEQAVRVDVTDAGDTIPVYVRTSAPHHVLRVGDDEVLTMTYSEHGSIRQVEVPGSGEYVTR